MAAQGRRPLRRRLCDRGIVPATEAPAPPVAVSTRPDSDTVELCQAGGWLAEVVPHRAPGGGRKVGVRVPPSAFSQMTRLALFLGKPDRSSGSNAPVQPREAWGDRTVAWVAGSARMRP